MNAEAEKPRPSGRGAVTQPVAIHYIGFRGDEFVRARRIWGGPVFVHKVWDRRAARDIGPDDIVIFAIGDETQPLARWNGDDIDERWLLPMTNAELSDLRAKAEKEPSFQPEAKG